MNQMNTTTKRDIKQLRTNDKHNNSVFRRRNHEEKKSRYMPKPLIYIKIERKR